MIFVEVLQDVVFSDTSKNHIEVIEVVVVL